MPHSKKKEEYELSKVFAKQEEKGFQTITYQMCPRCGKMQPDSYKHCLGCGLRRF